MAFFGPVTLRRRTGCGRTWRTRTPEWTSTKAKGDEERRLPITTPVPFFAMAKTYLRLARATRDNAGALYTCEKRTEKSPDWRGEIVVGRFAYRLSGWVQQTKFGDDYFAVKASHKQGGGTLFRSRGLPRTDVYRGDLTIARVEYRLWGRHWTDRYGRTVVSLVALPKEPMR